jgi:predicted ATPase/class 3 adenylate cyclase
MDVPASRAPNSLTLLFTDIEGSTSLWVNHPDAADAAISAHDRIISEAIGSHAGSVIKTTGDGFLASFGSVYAGIAAALDAQLALAAHAPELLDAAHVRMAIHTGVVRERQGDVFGLAVNKCERIMAAASAGQILLSNAAAGVAREGMPPGCGLIDLGDQRLRGIPDIERVYQVVHPELRREFPVLPTAAATPTNLPSELSSFVGRRREIDEIVSLTRERRLVTLTGEGGAGKTRLAVQVGLARMTEFEGGVWFVELDSLRDANLVPERIASTLNLDERPGTSYVDLLVEHLEGKHTLLIIDNCEHLLDASARVIAALLMSLPGVSVVATSRQRLGVPSESTYRVASMSLPSADDDLPAVAEHDSVTLFVTRAQDARPSFRLTDDNAKAVTRIVRQLDGIPLALELAAAKVSSMGAEQIADHLDDRFRLLTNGARTQLPRHQTLEAAIQWGYDLLTADEQRLLDQLSVFRGGFDLPGAESISGAGDVDVLGLVTSLVEKSFVVPDIDTARYRLLETIRQYAAARLSERGETDAVAERHAAFIIAFAEEAGDGVDGPEQIRWLSALETERDNLRAALEWLRDHESPQLLHLSSSVWRFWLLRRRPQEGREWLRQALRIPSDGHEEWRIEALLGSGGLASDQGDRTAASAFLGDALSLADLADDGRAASSALASMAVLHHKEGDVRGATELFREALLRARGASDSILICRVLTNLALVLADQGLDDEAAASAREALAVARGTEIPSLVADALLTAGEIALNRGSLTEAVQTLEEAYRVGSVTGIDDITAWARSYLGKVALLQGDAKASRALLAEAVEMFEDIQSPMGEEWSIRHLALADILGDDMGAARRTATDALRLASTYVRPDVPLVLLVCAQIAANERQWEDAATLLFACRKLTAELDLHIPPFEQDAHDRTWAAITYSLEDDVLEACKARGQSMLLDEAIDFAHSAMTSLLVPGEDGAS